MAEYVESYYSASRNLSLGQTDALVGNETADVCIVGGGLTGCSAALYLAQRGYRVHLLEAERIGWGASGRSGGQIIPGLSTDVGKLRADLGEDGARAVWAMTLEAVELVRERVHSLGIDCDLKWGYVHAATKARHLRELEHWHADLARHFNYQAMELLDRRGVAEHVVSPRYVGGIYQSDAGHLHPLNFTLGLAQGAQNAGARLHENSRVVGLERGPKARVRTTYGAVEADHVLLCGNAYLAGVAPDIEAAVMPVGSYILATEPLPSEQAAGVLPQDDAVADLNFVLDYYRLAVDRRLLFGGRVSYTARQPRRLEALMRQRVNQVFPQLAGVRADYVWGGFVGITRNRAPHFGRIGHNVYFAQGFSGHGMALTGLAGQLLGEAVAGQAERFDVFARITHKDFPGGRLMRAPLLALATSYYRLRDLL